MAVMNTDAVKRAIQDTGEPVVVTHYTGDQAYDANQNPIRDNSDTSTQAQIKEPNKFDVETGLNKITINDKKFELPKGVLIDVGDKITVTRTSDEFKVKLVNKIDHGGLRTKTIAFASLVE